MSPIRLKWKDDTTFSDLNRNNKESYESNCNAMPIPQSQPSTSPKETLGKELQESSASTDETNENEEITTHPQPAKRQRKKPAPRDQDFLWTT